MIVALGFQKLAVAVYLSRGPWTHGADSSEPQPCELGRHTPPRRDGEEQFVVFASVQSLREGCAAKYWRSVDFGAQL